MPFTLTTAIKFTMFLYRTPFINFSIETNDIEAQQDRWAFLVLTKRVCVNPQYISILNFRYSFDTRAKIACYAMKRSV